MLFDAEALDPPVRRCGLGFLLFSRNECYYYVWFEARASYQNNRIDTGEYWCSVSRASS